MFQRTSTLTAALLCLLMMVISIGSAPPAGAQPELSSIAGSVTNGSAAIADAEVIATQGSVNRKALTDASGNYTISGLIPGTYRLSVRPAATTSTSPSWVFSAEPTEVTVPPAASGVSLTVETATVTVTGRLDAPGDATFAAPNRAWVSAENQEGLGNTVQVAEDGSFTIMALPGAVLIQVALENDGWDESTGVSGLVYVAEAGGTVQVDGVPSTEAVDPIAIIEKSATIAGAVTVQGSGSPVVGIPVRAWRLDGAEFVQTISGQDGGYSLPVIPGAWMVRAVPLDSQAFVPAQPPVRVTVAEGAGVTQNLQIAAADVTVNGQLVDSISAEPVAGLEGRAVALYRDSEGRPAAGPTAAIDAEGAFTLKLASTVATTYTVAVYLAPDSGYSLADRPAPFSVSSAPNPLTVPVVAHNSTIAGTLRTRSGEALTGVAGAVYGASETGSWARTRINPADGSYSLPVFSTDLDGEGGTSWLLRAFVDPASGYLLQPPSSRRIFLPYGSGSPQSVTGIDFTALSVSDFGRIRGTVTAPASGGAQAPVSGVRVSVRELGATSDGVARWAYTDRQGRFELRAPAGSYQISAYHGARPGGARLIAPLPQTVSVTAQAETTVSLAFRSSDAVALGSVTYGNPGAPRAALVRARAADGTTVSARAGANGAFRLPLLAGVEWTIVAVSSDEGSFLRSAPATITPTPGENTGLALTLVAESAMPQSQVFAFDAAEDQLFVLGDGSQVEAPAGSFAAEGNLVLTVRPIPEIESAGGAEPVSFGYRLHAFSSGAAGERRAITRFLQPITLVIPFTAEQLADLGVTAEQLIPAYWDTASQSWKPVETVAVLTDDTGGGVVRISTTHFTDYALLTGAGQRLFLPMVIR